MKIFFLILFSLTILWLSGCQYAPYANKYTIQEPNKADIIGTYIFDSETVNIKSQDFQKRLIDKKILPEIELLNNETYTTKDLPYFVGDLTPILTGLLTIKGTWSKTTVGSVVLWKETKRQRWIQLNGLPQGMEYAWLLYQKKPYSIIFVFGDPDNGEVMIFRRK